MSVDQVNGAFAQTYSLPKVVAAEIALLIGAILPVTPSFSAHAYYTRFLYSWPFFLVVIVSCLYLAYLSLAMIPVLRRALFRLPAIEISSDEIVVHSNREKRAELSEIVSVTLTFGNLMIVLRNGKKFGAPVSLCEQPRNTLRHLLAVLPASVTDGMEPSF